jgi:uncharacterized membrane protein
MKRLLTDFGIGFIAGFVIAAVIFGIVAGAVHYRNKDREKIEYVELQQEIEALREDVINLTSDELLDLPDIRAAADGAAAEFIRKRDEALQRLRNRNAD